MSRTDVVLCGDTLAMLSTLPAESVNCIITSIPCNTETLKTAQKREEYVMRTVAVFREARRVLRDDGTLWWKISDTYDDGKNLVGAPWELAFALRNDGWILRSDIIWEKPNCMPETVRDRPTRSHEYIFLMAKAERYWFDAAALQVPASSNTHSRGRGVGVNSAAANSGNKANISFHISTKGHVSHRSGRTVVKQLTEKELRGMLPSKLVKPILLAGCPVGGVVLDPFCDTGMVGKIALNNGRHFVGIEENTTVARCARLLIKDAATRTA